MGFNLISAHPSDVIGPEEGQVFAKLLVVRFGQTVPLGQTGKEFILPNEMGWSWWKDLQRLAEQKMGLSDSNQIQAVDAWHGVYIDAKIEREVLWPKGKPDVKPPKFVTTAMKTYKPYSTVDRIKKFFGFRPSAPQVPSALQKTLQEMFEENGARKGEESGLQVGCLPQLLAEAEELLRRLDIEPAHSSVAAILATYENDDDRVDDDPAIQCLCHLWLTAQHALEHKQPLWLVK